MDMHHNLHHGSKHVCFNGYNKTTWIPMRSLYQLQTHHCKQLLIHEEVKKDPKWCKNIVNNKQNIMMTILILIPDKKCYEINEYQTNHSKYIYG
jgi:hypothetical protein